MPGAPGNRFAISTAWRTKSESPRRLVQKGEPQSIILNPSDAYIEKLVDDINRARVLRAESVMAPGVVVESDTSGQVDVDDNLEAVMAPSGGDLTRTFVVVRDGTPAGLIRMQDVFKALVPRRAAPPTRAGGPTKAAIKERHAS
jgi:glycine betaine/proline transport system ATP-binding protein